MTREVIMESTEPTPKEPVVKSTIEQIEALKGTEEFKQLLSNSNNSFLEAHIPAKQKEAYGHIDAVFNEVLGLVKDDSVKTSDTAREIALAYKALKESKGDTTKLDEAIEQGKQLSKAQIEALKKQVGTLEEQLKNKDFEGNQNAIKNELSNALSLKKFNPAYGETELKDLLDVRMDRIVSTAKRHEGKTIYYKDKEQQKPYLNTLFEPMTAEQVADEVFGSLYQVKKAGGNADATGVTTVEGDTVNIDMSKVTTFAEFNKQFKQAMATQGITEREPKYLQIQTATFNKFKIGEMPLE